ncbi:MAG: DNA internalization-related competence protein ComEC/Rec2 [Candidatus Binatia bacterium]
MLDKTGLLEKNPASLLIVPTLSLLAGQTVATFISLPPLFILLFSVLMVLFPFFLVHPAKGRWALVLLFSSAAFAGGFYMHQNLLTPHFPANHLRVIANRKDLFYLEGFHYREPDLRPDRSRWYLRAEWIWQPNGAQKVKGNILVTVSHTRREWHYGDRVRLKLKLHPPRTPGNPGEFDYEAYLARREIYLTSYLNSDAGVELLRRADSGLWVWIEDLRRVIRHFFENHLASDQARLMKALVVGDRGGLSKEMHERFTAAGVAHVLAISGLHVGMLAWIVFSMVRFIGGFSSSLLLRFSLPKIATCFALLAVFFYTALAGGMISTMRSAIMIGVYGLAVLADREDELLNSLCLAALFIGLFWPGAVMEISFQLSFLAVLFIIGGLRMIQYGWATTYREEFPQEKRWIRHRLRQLILYLAVPVLATVGTGPMIAHHFGRLSIVGFVSNPVLVPLVGFLLVPLGLMVGLFALLLPSAANPFLWIAEALLSLVLWLVRFFAGLPWARLLVPNPSFIEVGILYLILLSFFVVRRRSHFILLLAGIMLAVLIEGSAWWQQRWHRKELRITFLSVGYGDAAVVEFPGSKILLIDAGGRSIGKFDPGAAIVAPFLRSRKIRKVDYLLVSHPRIDHYGGMKTIVEEFAPTEFWSGPGKGRTRRYEELEESVERSGMKRMVLGKEDSCRSIDQVRLCVLYPPRDNPRGSSVVLRLSFGKVNLLFTGDIEKRDERTLLEQQEDLSAVVLKVPRHGSLRASSKEFIAAVQPKLAIFSVGHSNAFGVMRHKVENRFLETGSEILRTDRDGAIIIETDGRRVSYRSYRSGKKGGFDL